MLVDRYLTGKEIEVDAISDGETVIIPGIMEHIERLGVHSGDSIVSISASNVKSRRYRYARGLYYQISKRVEHRWSN